MSATIHSAQDIPGAVVRVFRSAVCDLAVCSWLCVRNRGARLAFGQGRSYLPGCL